MTCSIALASILRKKSLLVIALLCFGFSKNTYAFDHYHSYYGGEETILVEDSAKTSYSNSQTFKTLTKKLLRSYLGSLLSSGKQYTHSAIRTFDDLAQRTKYGINLKQERIELKLSLKF